MWCGTIIVAAPYDLMPTLFVWYRTKRKAGIGGGRIIQPLGRLIRRKSDLCRRHAIDMLF
jgi:hypothetical protein